MRVVKFEREKLISFLKSLEKFGDLWGPVKKGKHHVFAKDDPEKFDLKALSRTFLIPPKKFLIPSEFTMFTYKDGKWNENIEAKKKVVFGLHPCDINGFNILHKFFTRIYEDPYYKNYRDALLIVGLSCMPDEKCFCSETKTSTVEEGFDLFLTDLDDIFLLWVGSPKGENVIMELSDLFDENVTENDIEKYIEWRKKRDRTFKSDLDLAGMPEIVSTSYNREIWQELSEACYSCGRCVMVCPTCTCFDVYDEVDIKEDKIKRIRSWYGCVFREYSLVAGGHNFREARSERLKLWYTHKLAGFMSEYGKPACVGCGKCVETCPVEINIYTVAKALKNERFEAFWKKVEKLKEEVNE